MKVQIRQRVFETNSSSTHVLSLFNKEDWSKFTNSDNQILMDWWGDHHMLSVDDLKKRYEDECKKYPAKCEEDEDNFEIWLEEQLDNEEFISYESLSGRYEILTEEVPDSQYVAVSIWGYE